MQKFNINNIIIYINNQNVFLLNLMPILITLFILFNILNNIWISNILNNIFYIGLTLYNKYKIEYIDSPLKIEDFKYLNEINSIIFKDNTEVIKIIILVIIFIIMVSLFLKNFYNIKIDIKKLRILNLIIILILGIITLNKYYNIEYMESKLNNNIFYSEKERYLSNGFIYSFISNAMELDSNGSNNYNKEEAIDILNRYTDYNIEEKFNLIVILNDKYEDLTKYNDLQVDKTIYKNYYKMKREGISGNILINIDERLTNLEREIVTGYVDSFDYNDKSNSLVWYFKEQDYKVDYIIRGNAFDFNRDKINSFLGFDNTISINKDNLSDNIIKRYEESKDEKKYYFNFSLDILDNIKLANKYSDHREEYINKIKYVDDEIGNLIEYFNNEETPTIILFSSLGLPKTVNSNLLDKDLNIDYNTKEGFKNRCEHEYIIWGNNSSKEVFNKSFSRKGDILNANLLIPEIFEYLDLRGNRYIQYLNDKKEDFTAFNELYFNTDKGYIERTNETNYLEESYNELLNIENYYKNNFNNINK